MRYVLLVALLILLSACTSMKYMTIMVEKTRESIIEPGKKIALVVPEYPEIPADTAKKVILPIASAVFPQNVRLSDVKEKYEIDNPITIVKAAQNTRSEYVVYVSMYYSSFTAVPKEELYPDYNNKDKQQSYRHMLSVTVTYFVFEGKTGKELEQKEFRYEYSSTPFISMKRKDEWEQEMIGFGIREATKSFFQLLKGEEYKSERTLITE